MSSAIQVKQNPPACSQPLLSCLEGGANEGHDYSADSGVSEQDGEPPSPFTEVYSLLTETPGVLKEKDNTHGKHPADNGRQVPISTGQSESSNGHTQLEKCCSREELLSELREVVREVPNECDMKTDSDRQTQRKNSSSCSGHKSQDCSICNTNKVSANDDNKSSKSESVMTDMSTQTSPSQEAITTLNKSSKTDRRFEKKGHCVCICENKGNVPCNYCKLQSSCDDSKISVVKSIISHDNIVCSLETSDSKQAKDKADGPNMRQKRTSDYSSLSSCDSPSNRTSDSGNSPSSSSSSSCSTASGQSKRLKSSAFTKKVTTVPGGLSPIASCGGESNTGLTVDVCLVPEDIAKEGGGRSPCTPTSGCLKAGTRSASGAHVQFETPCDDNEESQMLQDTLVTSDGRVSLHKPAGGSATPTPTDHLSRFWSKLVSDSSPAEAVSSNLHRSKKYRKRHISGSSSISVGSSSSDSGESHATEFERKAPDGGWGWVIVAASFMVHCIADGVTMSFGVLFVELLNYFSVGKSLTSWVGSLFMAIPLLAGPLASILTDRYGCRTVTICGAVVACFGFFVSAFVNTFPLLLLTVGIVTGLGLAVCYVAAIVIVAFYFERKRSLATGIAVAGSGIGTFLFAPLIQYLVDYWGWRLCLIILAGIFLNMVVCGALMHDLEWTPKYSSNARDSNTAVSSRRSSTSQSSETGGGKGGSVGTTLPSLDELRRLVQSGEIMISPDDSPNEKLRNSASLVLLPTFLSRSQVLPPDVLPCLSSRTNAYEVVSHMYPHLLSHSVSGLVNQTTEQIQVPTEKQQHEKCTDENLSRFKDTLTDSIVSSTGLLIENSTTSPNSPQQPPTTENFCDTETTTPGSTQGDISLLNEDHRKKVDIELGCSGDDGDDADNEEEMEEARELTAMLSRNKGSRQPGQRRISTGCMGSSPPPPAAPLRNMRINRQSMMYRGAMLNINRYRLRASSCPDIYRNSIITIAKSEDENMWTYLDDMGEMITSCVDYSYCLDPGYLVFAISNFILYVFYDTVYMYLTDYAQGVGVSADDSANLISVIGILNCFGMVVMGYVGDRPWSSPMLIYNVSMILCGVSVIMMPFLTNYWLIAAASAVFGLFISANYALTSVILVELITLEAFSKAYGLLLLIQGIANLIGPPLVGLIADTTGDYIMPFVVSGLFIIFCGVILNLIPLIHCCQGKYAASVSSTPVDTPKNGSPSSSPNHTYSKKKPTPI
ncbi:uncharacterized protein [Macrobrachium rosenbergii]|uniref:uncharacterized protein n=1 Tax=Macrobrachium rosenbergii TaxID=79674 RepID=UPI0034D50BEA